MQGTNTLSPLEAKLGASSSKGEGAHQLQALSSCHLNSTLQSLLQTGPVELDCLSGHKRRVSGIFRPRSTSEVRAIVKMAQASKSVRLYPFCCGKNWGFGSNLPPADDVYLVDLSLMRSIRQLDASACFVEIEPGITQGTLDEILRQLGRTHYFNVTGAGKSTSVLGNALERGIGYFGSRNNDLLDLEVVLGDGSLIWTRGTTLNPHHTGLGPDLTDLFIQSSFGIVTAARLRLQKRPECMGVAVIQAFSQTFARFIDLLCTLRQEGAFDSVPHIGNRQRIITTFGPTLSPEHLDALKKTAPEWSCALPLAGSKKSVRAEFDSLCDRLGGLATCRLISPDLAPVDPVYADLVDLVQGIPNDFALPGVSFAALSEATSTTENLDSGRAGLIHVAPACSARSSEVLSILEIMKNLRKEAGFGELPVTLNLVNAGMIAVIISVPFDRRNTANLSSAKRLSEDLLSHFAHRGFLPYRLGLEDSQFLPEPSPVRARILRTLKMALDSNEVIGPSKYKYLWQDPLAPSAPAPDFLSSATELS